MARLGEEAAEGEQRRETAPGGGPAELAGLHPNAQMPLQAATQPSLRDLVEVQGIPPVRLVLAAGDPRVELQVPDLALPPIARVVGEAHQPVAAAQHPGEIVLAPRAWKLPSRARPRRQQLPDPCRRGRGHQRRAPRALARWQRLQHRAQPPRQAVERLVGHQAAELDDPPHAERQLMRDRLGQHPKVDRPASVTVGAERAQVLRRDPRDREVRRPQPGRDRFPQHQVVVGGEVLGAVVGGERQVSSQRRASSAR